MFDEVTLLARFAGVFLALWAGARLAQARKHKWKSIYTPKEKVSWNALFVGTLTAGEGAIEDAWQGNPGGPRMVLRLIFLIFVLWVTFTEDDRRITFKTEGETNPEGE